MVPIACANSTGRPCKESFYRVEIPSHILHSRARNVLEEEIEHKKAIAKPASLAKFDKFQNHTTLSHSGTRKGEFTHNAQGVSWRIDQADETSEV